VLPGSVARAWKDELDKTEGGGLGPAGIVCGLGETAGHTPLEVQPESVQDPPKEKLGMVARARKTPQGEHEMPWFRRRLLKWYSENGRSFWWREPERTPYEVLVAEILLQRTNASKVASFIPAFFEQYPSAESLVRAKDEALRSLLRPLGLWRAKTRTLIAAAEVLVASPRFPASRECLESLRGVGQYTASVMLSTFWGRPEPFLDVNMARVLRRFFDLKPAKSIRHDRNLQGLARQVVHSKNPSALNLAILDLSALLCRPKPRCESCPLAARCGWPVLEIAPGS